MRIAIFASGGGSNAASIIDYFRDHTFIEIGLIVTDNPAAGVLEIARASKISCLVASKELRSNGEQFLSDLRSHQITFIALAGYLRKVNPKVVLAYQDRMVNIHPALLPNHGGKGMFGMHVHRAVIKDGDIESGITIHFVNEQYDDGAIIKQIRCGVLPTDTAEDLQKRVLALEHESYPAVIEEVCMKLLTENNT